MLFIEAATHAVIPPSSTLFVQPLLPVRRSVKLRQRRNDRLLQEIEPDSITPRRRFLVLLGAAAAALAANLFGATSALLRLSPEQARKLRLDQIYPIDGLKRYVNELDGYEFLYPSNWLADVALYTAKDAARRPLAASFDEGRPVKRAAAQGEAPDVAFGPPGGGGDSKENVSVVKSTLRLTDDRAFFSLLGPPKQAAETLLREAIAPEGSGKVAMLIDALSEQREPGGEVYLFEYIVRGVVQPFEYHNLSVIACRGDKLFTLTVVSPEDQWAAESDKLRRMANSFRLTR
ncbi:unnamed protein product [Vitrella brassicaformis CCMP3155]|uniref:PsbP C-terminal domain-containing protein n=2 Tax=Vitrella brassicaformis TaxID=1169539 RepID=A0A0G4FDP7_VITBC|nr:unnamed protein product [Vitrella brassicaformis CCMP3155]|mmetsp:Transcript_10910/g.26439  ORF Transcript_10910/g.26439 Transcript_10910/m.26439 type:complete len:290 (+) Transcript_10910:28-897(+)|eukprot:CEM11308.1 unnamed protein product [Vitrella brassicaformis CCMP3155]